jgi:SNF2 family DNA or RNA helicase
MWQPFVSFCMRPCSGMCNTGWIRHIQPPFATVDTNGTTLNVSVQHLQRIPYLVEAIEECTSLRFRVEMVELFISRVIIEVDALTFASQVGHGMVGEVAFVLLVTHLVKENMLFVPHEACHRAELPDEEEETPSQWCKPLWSRQRRSLAWMRAHEQTLRLSYDANIKVGTTGWYVDTTAEVLTQNPGTEETRVRGGILSDGTGSGKTVVSLALAADHASTHDIGGTLIIVPLNLPSQWQREIDQFCAHLTVARMLSAKDLRGQKLSTLREAHIVITTFHFLRSNRSYADMVESELQAVGARRSKASIASWARLANRDAPIVEAIHWTRVIVDEMHEIADNPRDMRTLRQLRYNVCWGLTATPHINELNVENVMSVFTTHLHPNLVAQFREKSVRGSPTNTTMPNNSLMMVNATADERRLIQANVGATLEDVVKLCSFMSFEGDGASITLADMETLKTRITQDHILRLDTLQARIDEKQRCLQIARKAVGGSEDAIDHIERQMLVETSEYGRLLLDAQRQTAHDAYAAQTQRTSTLEREKNEMQRELDECKRALCFVRNRIDSIGSTNEECTICLEKRSDCITPCGHLFCRACITRSLRNDHSCPSCRGNLLPSELHNVTVGSVGSKLVALAQLVNELDEPVIIFSQWKTMLRELRALLRARNTRVSALEGNGSHRALILNEFETNGGVLLLRLDESFSGLHLPGVRHVIFAHALLGTTDDVRRIETQAVARAMRPGQTRRVHVYSFVISDCAEETQWRATHDELVGSPPE